MKKERRKKTEQRRDQQRKKLTEKQFRKLIETGKTSAGPQNQTPQTTGGDLAY